MAAVVVMGVSGCGKSSLARALADAMQLPLIEGDDFHSAASVAKMQAGVALTDADRHDWSPLWASNLPPTARVPCSPVRR